MIKGRQSVVHMRSTRLIAMVSAVMRTPKLVNSTHSGRPRVTGKVPPTSARTDEDVWADGLQKAVLPGGEPLPRQSFSCVRHKVGSRR